MSPPDPLVPPIEDRQDQRIRHQTGELPFLRIVRPHANDAHRLRDRPDRGFGRVDLDLVRQLIGTGQLRIDGGSGFPGQRATGFNAALDVDEEVGGGIVGGG